LPRSTEDAMPRSTEDAIEPVQGTDVSACDGVSVESSAKNLAISESLTPEELSRALGESLTSLARLGPCVVRP